MDIAKITPHLELKIKGSEPGGGGDLHLATIDHLDGENFIKLTRREAADGRHHWIPVTLIKGVDESAAYVECTIGEFELQLLDSNPDVAS